jgi:tetratricopeptide (TPR) repeat protein
VVELKEAIELTKAAAPVIQSWPSPQDYNESVQNPCFCFSDRELCLAESELNVLGLPKPASGNFASVYHFYDSKSDWAVRCFLQPLADQEQRYQALSAKLTELDAAYLADFNFVSQGIRVGNQWYPIVKMEWVRGQPLLQYIESHLQEAEVLQALADSFKQTILAMQSQGIAHGDLQHGNIMVETDGQIRLVDYDGCFVPELAGKTSNELGHRNYQHPLRTAMDFNEKMDNFSAWLIWISIVTLAEDPWLWSKLEAGDECLLLRRQDLINPRFSRVFHVLELHSNESIRLKARYLRSLIGLPPSKIPCLSQQVAEPQKLPLLESIVKLPAGADMLQNKRKASSNGPEVESKPVESIDSIWAGHISAFKSRYSRSAPALKARRCLKSLRWSSSGDPLTSIPILIALSFLVLCSAGGVAVRLWQAIPARNLHDGSQLYEQAQNEFSRGNSKLAEKYFQDCLEAKNDDGVSALSPLELAKSWECLSICKCRLQEKDYGQALLNASEIYESLGQYRAANADLKLLADTALSQQQYELAFDTCMVAITEHNIPNENSKLVNMAVRAAVEMALLTPANSGAVPAFTKQMQNLWDKPEGLAIQTWELRRIDYEANKLESSQSELAEAMRLFVREKSDFQRSRRYPRHHRSHKSLYD